MEPILFAKLSVFPVLALNLMTIYELKNGERYGESLIVNIASAVFISLFLILN